MTTVTSYSKKVFLFVTLSIISSFYFNASAQNTASNSRVAVVSNATKTNIWVTDFPKKASVIITDSDNNLLSIVSTNDFGAAFITLPSSINGVVAKTLDGEIIVSNKAVTKNKSEENVVAAANGDLNKA